MNDIVQRWRLVLGTEAQETTGCVLGERELRMDKALAALYPTNVSDVAAWVHPRRRSVPGWATSASFSRSQWCR